MDKSVADLLEVVPVTIIPDVSEIDEVQETEIQLKFVQQPTGGVIHTDAGILTTDILTVETQVEDPENEQELEESEKNCAGCGISVMNREVPKVKFSDNLAWIVLGQNQQGEVSPVGITPIDALSDIFKFRFKFMNAFDRKLTLCQPCAMNLIHLYQLYKQFTDNCMNAKSFLSTVIALQDNDQTFVPASVSVTVPSPITIRGRGTGRPRGRPRKIQTERFVGIETSQTEDVLLPAHSIFGDDTELGIGKTKELEEGESLEGPRKVRCKTCYRLFKGDSQLMQHMKTHMRRLTCPVCGRTFQKSRELRKHLKLKSHVQALANTSRLLEEMKDMGLDDSDDEEEASLDVTTESESSEIPKALESFEVEINEEEKQSELETQTTLDKETEANTETQENDEPIEVEELQPLDTSSSIEKESLNEVFDSPKKYLMSRVECTVCGNYFANRAHLDLHMIKHNKNYPVQMSDPDEIACAVCGRQFSHNQHLQQHMKTHSRRPECTVCNRVFRYPYELKKHQAICRPAEGEEGQGEPQNTEETPEETPEEVTIKENASAKKKPAGSQILGLVEEKDAFGFGRRRSLRVRKTPKKLTMTETDESGDGENDGESDEFEPYYDDDDDYGRIKRKRKTVKTPNSKAPEKPEVDPADRNPELECKVCKRYFQHVQHLQMHMQTHTRVRPTCSVCKKVFKTQLLLDEHFNVHKGLKPYPCSDCGKSFPTKKSLQCHIVNNHGPPKLHKCKACKKFFQNGKALRKHIRYVHETDDADDKRFECTHCDKVFARKERLRNHEKIHSRPTDTIFACDQCGRNFVSKNGLRIHELTHKPGQNTFQFQCQFCGKRYETQEARNRHEKFMHRLASLHTCEICGKSFGRKNSLKVHISGFHMGERKYLCSTCGKSYKNLTDLKHHEMSHKASADYRFSCGTCGRKFYRSRMLRIHQLKEGHHHTDVNTIVDDNSVQTVVVTLGDPETTTVDMEEVVVATTSTDGLVQRPFFTTQAVFAAPATLVSANALDVPDPVFYVQL